jgi:hypothetical protein
MPAQLACNKRLRRLRSSTQRRGRSAALRRPSPAAAHACAHGSRPARDRRARANAPRACVICRHVCAVPARAARESRQRNVCAFARRARGHACPARGGWVLGDARVASAAPQECARKSGRLREPHPAWKPCRATTEAQEPGRAGGCRGCECRPSAAARLKKNGARCCARARARGSAGRQQRRAAPWARRATPRRRERGGEIYVKYRLVAHVRAAGRTLLGSCPCVHAL